MAAKQTAKKKSVRASSGSSKKAAPTAAAAPVETKLVAYKGFDKNLQCRGFQYEVGKSYSHSGDVVACQSGLHSCLNPLDVLSYYPFIESRFAVVEASGKIAHHGDDSKIASAELHIKAELTLPQFIKSAIDWMAKAAKSDDKTQAASGNYSKLAASGYSSNLAASGNYSKLAASGKASIALAANVECTASAGELGCIGLTYWDGKRYRTVIGYIGENGLKPNVAYRLNGKHEFEAVK